MVKRLKSIAAWVLAVAIIPLFVSCGAKDVSQLKGEEAVQSAWRDYALGEYDRAIDQFTLVLENSAQGSDASFQALFGLATTWSLRRPDEDPELAAEYYQRILDENPQHELAAWSLLALARMQHLVPPGEDPDYDHVRKMYRNVINRYPEHLAADEAFIYLQGTYAAQMTPEGARKALDALERFVQEKPDSGFVSAAYSLMSVCYETLNEPQKRLDAELAAYATAEVDPENPFQDNAWRYWMLGALAEFNVGDFDTARKYYKLLIEEYPTDIRKYSAEQALRRMDQIEEQIRQELADES